MLPKSLIRAGACFDPLKTNSCPFCGFTDRFYRKSGKPTCGTNLNWWIGFKTDFEWTIRDRGSPDRETPKRDQSCGSKDPNGRDRSPRSAGKPPKLHLEMVLPFLVSVRNYIRRATMIQHIRGGSGAGQAGRFHRARFGSQSKSSLPDRCRHNTNGSCRNLQVDHFNGKRSDRGLPSRRMLPAWESRLGRTPARLGES